MKSPITVLAALAVAANFAVAVDTTPTPAHHKKGCGKQRLTPAERFAKLDTNHDNSLSLDEFKAGRLGRRDPAKAEEVFKRKDTNNDGKLSLEEFSTPQHKKGGKQ